MLRLPRYLTVLLALLFGGCAPLLADEALWAGAEDGRLEASPPRGLVIGARRTGGRARPVRLDTDPIDLALGSGGTCDDFEATADDDLFAGCEAGGYGHGMGAAGLGASGFGGGGGLGAGGAPGGPLAEDATRARPRAPLEASPWGWAVVDLPYRHGPPARFAPRPEATVHHEVEVRREHMSTFGVDVDTAAYAITRRALLSGGRVEPTLVRTEELLNSFRYRYPQPSGLVGVYTDGARSPYDPARYLLRIGVAAKDVRAEERRPVNLVFLIDTSCSMTGSDRLELVKDSLQHALDTLGPDDEVALVTYAGDTKVALPATPATDRARIEVALRGLTSEGGTAMGSGLELAYQQAERMHRPGERSHVVVCSDGDANIGPSRADALLAFVADHARRGVALSTVGFGEGNYRDRVMERLANEGDGAYHYVDAPRQARRVFAEDIPRGLQEVARDVKVQVALDAAAVEGWRLVGYENRRLRNQDFDDDAVDAGDVGSGHQVTAIYELALRPGAGGTLGEVRVRARPVDGGPTEAQRHLVTVDRVARPFTSAPADLRFAAAVMGFSEHLRGARGVEALQAALHIARTAGAEQDPDRAELVALAERRLSDTRGWSR